MPLYKPPLPTQSPAPLRGVINPPQQPVIRGPSNGLLNREKPISRRENREVVQPLPVNYHLMKKRRENPKTTP